MVALRSHLVFSESFVMHSSISSVSKEPNTFFMEPFRFSESFNTECTKECISKDTEKFPWVSFPQLLGGQNIILNLFLALNDFNFHPHIGFGFFIVHVEERFIASPGFYTHPLFIDSLCDKVVANHVRAKLR